MNSAPMPAPRVREVLRIAALAAITVVAYSGLSTNGFINLDDRDYLFSNELAAFSSYMPDVDRLRLNRVPMRLLFSRHGAPLSSRTRPAISSHTCAGGSIGPSLRAASRNTPRSSAMPRHASHDNRCARTSPARAASRCRSTYPLSCGRT